MNRKIFTGISGIRKVIFAAALVAASAVQAFAQTTPNWTYGFVPTPAQWSAEWASKQDYLGSPPVLTTGGTMTGKLTTAASTATTAGLNLPAGVAPTTPLNGDIWSTSGGLFVQINGATVGPLSSAAAGSFTASSPITVNFPGGGVTNYACATCGVTGSPLSQFASTTSAQLAGVISNETGTGLLVFNNGAALVAPVITTSFTATGLVGLTNLASQSANTIVGAASVGSPTALSIPNCVGSANALQWTAGTGFGCQAIVAAAGSVAIGTTTITGGTVNNILVHGASNLLQEYTLSGSGTAVAMAAAPVIVGGSHTAITNLGIRSTASAFDMAIANAEVLTANRALTIALNDASRVLQFSGNVTFGGAFQTAGAFSLILTQTAATNVTLPNSGTLATLAGSEALSNKTINGLAITSTGGGAALAISSGASLTVTQALTLSGTNSTTMTFPSTSATIARTDAAQTFTGTQTFSGAIAANNVVQITSANSFALTVGANGTTNPAFNVDANTASSVTGIGIKSAAAGGGVSLAVGSSATDEALFINARGAGGVSIGATSTGGVGLGGVTAVTSTASNCFNAGRNGLTNPALQVDCSTASSVTGLVVRSAAAGNGVQLAAISTGTNEPLVINAKAAAAVVIGNNSTGGVQLAAGGGGIALNGTITTASVSIAGGASVTTSSLTTGSITVDCTTRPLQQIVGSTSAWSITAPAADSSCIIKLVNAASSAVAPSFSGFSVGTNVGDPLTTVGSSAFMIWIARIGGTSTYSIKALQ